MTHRSRLVSTLWLFASVSAGAQSADPAPSRPVVIAAKPFGESYFLAELFAQHLEHRGIPVTRRGGLGATEIAFPALQRGDIDVYPEYTGTGLLVILKEPATGDAASVFDRVAREFRQRFDVTWLPPLGFENTYAMAVRRSFADSLGLRTLSDLVARNTPFRAGLTADFIGLPDGLPGLRTTYGLNPSEVNALAPAVKYEALATGAVDLIDGYSTDGLLAKYPLTVLADDRRFFPPYDAAAVVNGAFARRNPGAVAALAELSGRIPVHRMREWNRRVEVDQLPVATVARDALVELGLTTPADTARRVTSGTASFPAYLWAQRADVARHALRHLGLVLASLLLACMVAIPLGLRLATSSAAESALRGIGVLQTIPGIALLAFMLPLLGIGVWPAVAALFLYSLYPILRNTVTGLNGVDAGTVDAARALGMSEHQLMRQVRLPLAIPVIMAGVRTATVLNVGTATLAAFIGGGGLGEPIVAGLALANTNMVLSGAVPSAALAILADLVLGRVQRRLARH